MVSTLLSVYCNSFRDSSGFVICSTIFTKYTNCVLYLSVKRREKIQMEAIKVELPFETCASSTYGDYIYIFSSPELKAQVSFVRCPSIVVVGVVVNFLNFHLPEPLGLI